MDTEAISARLREKSVDLPGRRVLVTCFPGTEQEKDLTVPANCNGFGRIHHFRRATSPGWPENPLPIDPACRHLGLPKADAIKAQVFQNAACCWRCWYCFVPHDLLSGSSNHSQLLSAGELIDTYLQQSDRSPVIDLTGGQPELVPEWVPWMMRELRERGLEQAVYLWSDDNLSNDYVWQHLTQKDREYIASYRGYGRVCCFKGFDAESFVFNTGAEPECFARQFAFMRRLLNLGIDLYAYATFTTPRRDSIKEGMPRFLDSLQAIHPNLPLRTIPLEIRLFTTVKARMNGLRQQAVENQRAAVEAWLDQLSARFSNGERAKCIVDVPFARESNASGASIS
jgi:uncharacterized Fe-S cluster-containing radical SAM superfamily protein